MEHVIIEVRPGSPVDTIQKAIALLPPDDGTPAGILIHPGVYREKLVLARANTTLCGSGADCTRIVWGDGAYEILEDGMKRGTFRTATLRTDAPHIALRGLTIENDAAPREAVGQAIALYADGDFFSCEDCILKGAQDTLFTAPLPPKEIEKNGFIGPKQYAPRMPQRHIYSRCVIEGDVDFIFGGAAAWFEGCDVVSINRWADRTRPYVGYAAAPSTPEGQAFGYVFSNCRFLSEGVPEGSAYIARPWREWAKCVLLSCQLGGHIAASGFDDWGKPLAHETALFAEFASYGPGAQGTRADFVRALSREEADQITKDALMACLT